MLAYNKHHGVACCHEFHPGSTMDGFERKSSLVTTFIGARPPLGKTGAIGQEPSNQSSLPFHRCPGKHPRTLLAIHSGHWSGRQTNEYWALLATSEHIVHLKVTLQSKWKVWAKRGRRIPNGNHQTPGNYLRDSLNHKWLSLIHI